MQLSLGWGLGVAGAGLTVLIAATILSALTIADAGESARRASGGEGYDHAVCASCALAVAAAVALLYLPLPWGGIGAAGVIAALAVSLRCV
ncbi:MAG: hypothetical protein ACRDLN_05185 [Solirubrobacteraceae bacterium]